VQEPQRDAHLEKTRRTPECVLSVHTLKLGHPH
jgi:hypothetical protein